MWDQTCGCANQYMCYIAYYLISFISKSYQIVIDLAVDTPGYGKYAVVCFNAFQKLYFATCLIMRSTPELDNIDSKRMRFDAMTKKGEVSFAK